MAVISTRGVPPRDRFDFWRDAVGRAALQFRMEPVKHAPWAEARVVAVGGVGIMRCDGSVASRYTRTPAEISRSQAPRFFVQIQLRGRCLLDHRGTQSLLDVGDALAADPLRRFDMRFVAPDDPDKRVLIAGIGKETIAARVARPDLIHAAVLRRRSPITRLLTSYLLSGLEIGDDVSADGAALFESHVADLLAQALHESLGGAVRPSESLAEALFVRACRLIRLRCADPGLGPRALARELYVSTRLLQRIFAQRGETVMKRIYTERVAAAAALLGATDASHRTITEIAFACGFNDSSHFGRVFASQMSMTPREWRKRSQGE